MRPLFIISLVLLTACAPKQRDASHERQLPVTAEEAKEQLYKALDELAALVKIHKDSPDPETQAELIKSKNMLIFFQHDSTTRPTTIK